MHGISTAHIVSYTVALDMDFEPSIREILLQITALSTMQDTQGAKGKKKPRSASTTQVLLFTATWPNEVRIGARIGGALMGGGGWGTLSHLLHYALRYKAWLPSTSFALYIFASARTSS